MRSNPNYCETETLNTMQSDIRRFNLAKCDQTRYHQFGGAEVGSSVLGLVELASAFNYTLVYYGTTDLVFVDQNAVSADVLNKFAGRDDAELLCMLYHSQRRSLLQNLISITASMKTDASAAEEQGFGLRFRECRRATESDGKKGIDKYWYGPLGESALTDRRNPL